MRDLIIIDVETTGVTPGTSSIIQLGAIEFSKGQLISYEFNQFIKPYREEWSKEAEEVHHINRNWLMKNGGELDTILKLFEEWVSAFCVYDLKKYLIASWGYFDMIMLQDAYRYIGRSFPFYHRHLDIASIARFYLESQNRLKVSKRRGQGVLSCARALGIEMDKDKAHDALYDATITGKILETIHKEIKV